MIRWIIVFVIFVVFVQGQRRATEYDQCNTENSDYCPTTCSIEEKIRELEFKIENIANEEKKMLIKTSLIIENLLDEINGDESEGNVFLNRVKREVDAILWEQKSMYQQYMDMWREIEKKKLLVAAAEVQIKQEENILNELLEAVVLLEDDCGAVESIRGLSVRLNLEEEKFEYQQSRRLPAEVIQAPVEYCRIHHPAPRLENCLDLLRQGYVRYVLNRLTVAENGIYYIQPSPGDMFPVYCDMQNGGWIVLQRRYDGHVNFQRSWVDYREGFGDIENMCSGEFWLGNTRISSIVGNRFYTVRFKLTDWNNETRFAQYTYFRINSELGSFTLQTSGFDVSNSNASNAMTTERDEYNAFSTFDRLNDNYPCTRSETGGWWFGNSCNNANLNGDYQGKNHNSKGSMRWDSKYALKASEVWIQP